MTADRTVVVRLVGMVGQYRAAMAEAMAATNALGAAVSRTNAQSTAATTALMRNQQRSMTGVGSTMRSMGKMMAGFGVPIGVGLMVKSWLDFERQMAHTSAVTSDVFGKSDVGQRRLRSSALSLGAAYGFSATEVGKAQEELAKAGRSTIDVLGGDLPAALTLAAAGTIGLDDAAKHIAVSMTQFKDTGALMTHQTITAAQVADLLARSANATVSDVDAMATALSYVGPQAASLNMSMQETVTTIALLNQAGIDGDRAGTNLRGMLTGLMSPSHMAKVQMDELGLSVFNAKGEFVGMAALAQELQDKLGGKTMAEQQRIIGKLTTNAAMPAFIILTKAGAAGWDLMKRKIDAAASATDVAKAKLDSVTGSLSIFGATMTNSAIKTVENFNGVISGTAEKATSAVGAFGEMGMGAQLATLAMIGQVFVARRVNTGLGTLAGGYRAVKTETANFTREQTRLTALQNRIGTGPGQVRPGFAAMSGLTAARIAEQERVVAAAAARASAAGAGTGVLGRVFGTGAGTASAQLGAATNAAGKFGSVFKGAMAGANVAARGLMGVMGGPWGVALMGGLALYARSAAAAEANIQKVQELTDSLAQLGAAYLTTGSVSSSAITGLIAQGGPLNDLVKHTKDYGISLTDVAEAASGNRQAQKSMLDVYGKQLMETKKAQVAAMSSWGDFLFVEPLANIFTDTNVHKSNQMFDVKNNEFQALKKEFDKQQLLNDITKEAKAMGLEEALGAIGKSGTEASEGVKAMSLNLQAMSAEGAKAEDVLKAGTANINSMAAAYLSVAGAQAAFRASTLGGDAAKSFGVEKPGKGARPTIKPRVDFVTGQFSSKSTQGLEQHAAASKMAEGAFALAEAAQSEAFIRMPKTLKDIGAAGLVATQQFQNARTEFVATYTALGMNAKQANKLADAYGLIPADFAVQIGANGADETIGKLNKVGVQMQMIPSTGEVVLTANTEAALRKIVGLKATVQRDPITGQVKYVVSDTNVLGRMLEKVKAAAKPVEVPIVPKMQFGSANAAEHWMASQKAETTVTVTPKVEPTPPIPNAPIKLDPTVNPTPPIPNAPIHLDPSVGAVHIPPQTVWVTPRLTSPIPSSIAAPTPPRWGAVHSYASGGIHAKIGKGDLIRWAEPETGGEAYIPRLGDRGRSKAILETAASWYGFGLHKMAAGGITSFATGGVAGALPAVPLGEFLSRYMDQPDNWLTRRTDAMISQRDAALAVKDAEASLREVQKDSKHTVMDLVRAQNALTDSRRNLATANLQLGKAKVAPRDQFKAALDMGVRNTASFIANLNILARQGYGSLAMQLLQMGGPEAEAIAAGAKSWPSSVATRMNKQAQAAQAQQKTLENMPSILAIRAAMKKGQSYDELIGAGVATAGELNAALETMKGELSKTPAGRAMLAAMSGGQAKALSAALRGYPTGLDVTGGRAALAPAVVQPSNVPAFSKPAGAGAVQITVKGEGVLSNMIEATVDGRLVTVTKAVTHGSLVG